LSRSIVSGDEHFEGNIMRLSEKEINIIKNSVYHIDELAKIYLFGSRVDDEKKGGDIDLLILSPKITRRDKRKIKLALYDALGEQKIDILVTYKVTKPFEKIALKEGVEQVDYLANLQNSLRVLDETLYWLKRSHAICLEIGIKEKYEDEEFDAFETLTGRFARASDIVIQKLFRNIDEVEFESPGTLLDVLNRAHKRELIPSIEEIRLIRELRNEIAHEYVDEDIKEIFKEVLELTPKLLEITGRIKNYCKKYEP
jgi:predicted nucleotidyltransferase/uncharacterized protein YutE (UPF0331/DUF86 family)